MILIKEKADYDSDDLGEYIRTCFEPNTICMPSEYAKHFKKDNKIFRVCKSKSDASWVLTVDVGCNYYYPYTDGDHGGPQWDFDQKGDYIKTIGLCRNIGLQEAIQKARIYLEDPRIILWVDDGFEYKSNNLEFDTWFASL